MSGYIGTQPVPQATQTRDSFTATSGQTSFATGGYTPNFLDVYLNGVKLAAADYTASNGSDVVLASGAATGDILEVVAFTTFTPANIPSGTPSIDDNGDATAITIDSNENVGIGTSSPSRNLTVSSSGQTDLAIIAASGSSAQLCFGDGDDDNVGQIEYSHPTDSMRFYTQGAEQMRISSSGNVGIGCSPTYRLDVDSGGSVSAARLRRNTDGSLRTVLLFLSRSNSNTVGSISISNSATAYNTSSDYRLKENVVDLTGASARVNQLNPSRFNWIADDTNTAVDGFLAHEVATVVPEAITGTKDAMKDEEYEVTPAVEATYDEDGNELTAAVEAVMGTRSVPDYQGIDQSKLVPLLTAALQEALTEIASLKTRVEALEG